MALRGGGRVQARKRWAISLCLRHYPILDGEDPNCSRCLAGETHRAKGFNFELRYRPPYAACEEGWRYCSKCDGLFSNETANKGVCPAGDSHEAAGLEFVLQSPVLKHYYDGPGMSASGLTAAGWLDITQSGVGVDVSKPLQLKSGEVDVELQALNRAPVEGWSGPPVVAWADGLHAERLYITYRSTATYWDQGLAERGAQVGPLGSIVAHLVGTPAAVSTMKWATFMRIMGEL